MIPPLTIPALRARDFFISTPAWHTDGMRTETYTRSVSALAVLMFLGIGIHHLIMGGLPVHHAVFQFVIIGCITTVPLVYDIFRSGSVKYYVLTLAVCAAALSLITVFDGTYFSLTVIVYAALMAAFSTVWIRAIRIFYGIIGILLCVTTMLFIYAYTYGHYGVNPLNPVNWHWSEVLPVLSVMWLVVRSWCLSTYAVYTGK